MRTGLKAVLIFVLILATRTAFATNAPMDIYEAIDLTLKNNATLRSLKQEINKATAFKLKADGASLPSLTASGNINKQKESIFVSDGSELNQSKSALGIMEQTLYSGGKNSAMRRQSSQKKAIAEMMIATGENRALGELFGRFYNFLLQK